jgi:hypothetical protein
MANKITAIIDIVTGDARSSLKKLRQDIDDTDGIIGKLKVGAKGGFAAIKQNIGAFSVASAGALAAFGGDVLAAGVSMEAMDAKAEVVFGDGIGRMQDWAKESAGALGLTERKAIDAGASIQDLLVPMGFARDEAQDMTLSLLDVSGALSAWSGGKRSVEEVSATLTKALLGEREELKALGISITEADVQTRLAEKGQKAFTGAALAQAKAIATQELIYEKSTDAQRAWSDGSMDATKNANEGKASFAAMGETLSEALYPAVVALTPAIQDMADAAVKLAPAIKFVGDAVSGVVNVVTGAPGKVKEFFAGLSEGLRDMPLEWTDEAIQGITNSLNEMEREHKALTATEKAFNATQRETNREIDKGHDRLRDYEVAAVDTGAEIQALTDDIARLRGELDQEQAALDFKAAIDDFGQAMVDAAGDTDAQAAAIIGLKGDMLDYLQSLQGVPLSKQTEILALIDAGKLQEAEKLLNDLARTRTATVQAGVGQFSGSSGAPKPPSGGKAYESLGPDGVSIGGGSTGSGPVTVTLNAYGVNDPTALLDLINKEIRRNGGTPI